MPGGVQQLREIPWRYERGVPCGIDCFISCRIFNRSQPRIDRLGRLLVLKGCLWLLVSGLVCRCQWRHLWHSGLGTSFPESCGVCGASDPMCGRVHEDDILENLAGGFYDNLPQCSSVVRLPSELLSWQLMPISTLPVTWLTGQDCRETVGFPQGCLEVQLPNQKPHATPGSRVPQHLNNFEGM